MPSQREVVILGAARTAVGSFGGSLQSVAPVDLGACVVKEAVLRSGVTGEDVDHVVFGNVIHTEPRDMYLSRVASMAGGVPQETPALTLNRLCGSGLQAIISAAQLILLGDAKTALGGGAESMSRSGYLLPSLRWGQRMGDVGSIDMVTGVLHDPFGNGHMGVTAENLAKRYGISREEQDLFALESHRRAFSAIEEGRFKEQIVPVEIRRRRETILFDTDEHVRPGLAMEDISSQRAAFQKDGTVTAGNSSGLNDGAAAVLMMEASEAEKRGLKPLARVVAYGHSGCEPSLMGIGPVAAVKNALARAQLSIADLDVIESNEAFAAQAIAVNRALKLPSEKVNSNGGAIALGHPIGASGAIITVKCLYELQRTGGRYGLITMCIGGGQGIALVVERL